MNTNPVLNDTKPDLAKELESLGSRFAGGYDLTKTSQQAKFVEGVHLLGEFAALNSSGGHLDVQVGSDGLGGFTISCTPRK